jgi:hypothetical protein
LLTCSIESGARRPSSVREKSLRVASRAAHGRLRRRSASQYSRYSSFSLLASGRAALREARSGFLPNAASRSVIALPVAYPLVGQRSQRVERRSAPRAPIAGSPLALASLWYPVVPCGVVPPGDIFAPRKAVVKRPRRPRARRSEGPSARAFAGWAARDTRGRFFAIEETPLAASPQGRSGTTGAAVGPGSAASRPRASPGVQLA